MAASPARRTSLRLLAAAAALAVASVGLLPSAASAAGELVGGFTPAAAVPVPITELTGGSFGATNVGAPEASYAAAWAGHVAWYSYVPQTSGLLDVDVVGDPYWDTTVELWAGAPGSGGALLGVDDDAYGLNHSALADRSVTAGTMYYIGLGGCCGGPGANTGTATLTLTLEPRLPSPPLNVRATPADAGATVAWDPPLDPSGTNEYRVLYRAFPDGDWLVQSVPGDTTTATLTGLTNGQLYAVRVRARNAAGTSDFSDRALVTPMAVPTIALTTTPTTPTHLDDYQITVAVTGNGGPVRGQVHITVQNVDRGWFPLNPAGQRTINANGRRVGSYTVTVEYSGWGAVLPGTQSFTVVVDKDPQTVDFALAGPVAYGTSVDLAATASSGLAPVTFASDTPATCTVSGTSLSFVDVGPCTVTATQAGDATVALASAAQTVQVVPAAQTISVQPLAALVFGGAPVPLVGSATSGLPVTFAGAGACSVDGTTLTITDVGPCTVTASQPGSSRYLPAAPVDVTVDVAKRAQVVTIAALPLIVRGVVSVPVVATSDLGLPVTLSATGACVVDGTAVRTVATGACEITATQAGDAVTLPASSTSRVLVEAGASALTVLLRGDVGDDTGNVAGVVSGNGLKPGAEVSLTVYSTPTRLTSTTIRADGSAGVVGMLPEDLPSGTHRLVARGVALDGSAVETVLAFGVAEDGTVAWIGTAPALARTGTEPQDSAVMALLWVVAGIGLLGARQVVRRRIRPTTA